MADQFEPTESLAAIRARLLAGGLKAAERRAARRPKRTHAEEVRGMQKRAWAKINAERADASQSAPVVKIAPEHALAQPALKTVCKDRLAAARKRGMQRTE
ncbi:hypothetical protein [Mesorhizobium marinum]|uniref:hypothetical protein n=1 Tax=Mesorhizobium marinum TaxID=3228790 RepID=UPI0034657764